MIPDSLPFGTVAREDIADGCEPPFCYAELQMKNGRLDWYGEDYSGKDGFYLIMKLSPELPREEPYLVSEKISEEEAREIAAIKEYSWDYVE